MKTTHRIDQALAAAPPGLWPFIPAGYPSLAATAALLARLAALPVRGFEIGFPFSDPIADGPVIQHAFTHALAHHTRVADVFATIAALRPRIDQPLLAMVSASIVTRIGPPRFFGDAQACGFDGLIIPDLSLEEAAPLSELAAKHGLALSMLLAPTTPPQRAARIARAASGFLYCVSIQGTTGQRDRLPPGWRERVAQIKSETGLPVLVGFGISTRSQVVEVCGGADGAIVGSAIVGLMKAAFEQTPVVAPGRSPRRVARGDRVPPGPSADEAAITAAESFVRELSASR